MVINRREIVLKQGKQITKRKNSYRQIFLQVDDAMSGTYERFRTIEVETEDGIINSVRFYQDEKKAPRITLKDDELEFFLSVFASIIENSAGKVTMYPKEDLLPVTIVEDTPEA